jgi:hypothetical protein
MDNVEPKWTLRGQRRGYLDTAPPTQAISPTTSPHTASGCPSTPDEILGRNADRGSDCPSIPGRSVQVPSIPTAEDSPRDAQAFWDGEYTPMPQLPAATGSDTSLQGRR